MGLFDPTNTVTMTIVGVTCGKCGVLFGLDEHYRNALLESHETFYCPNGHARAYPGQSAKEKRIADLERENKAVKSSKEYWEGRARSAIETVNHQERRINGYKGVVARTKKKISAGRCPCCSHQFKNLESHMKTQHPNYNPERGAEALSEKA